MISHSSYCVTPDRRDSTAHQRWGSRLVRDIRHRSLRRPGHRTGLHPLSDSSPLPSPLPAPPTARVLPTYKRLGSPLPFAGSPVARQPGGQKVAASDRQTESKDNWWMKEDKENSPAPPPQPLTPLVRRRSSFFSPVSLHKAWSQRLRDTQPATPVRDTQPCVYGQGRSIPLMQGHLYKRCGRLHMYTKKYCTLLHDRLVYFPSLHAYLAQQQGKEILLSAVTVKVAGLTEGRRTVSAGDTTEQYHSLTIVSLSQSSWSFGCPREGVRDAWVEALNLGIKTCLQESGGGVRGDVESDRLLDLVLRDPGNTRCADCRRAQPEWCSINLGILVCIECSGAHRKLGSHVSKVRSLFLDQLDPGSLMVLVTTGNRRAALEWEVGMVEDERLGEHSTREEREVFVYRKYVTRQWRESQ